MNVEYSTGTLNDEDENDWHALADILGGSDHPVVCSIIRHLITLSVKSYLVESRYIDRDYSSDYRQFYAQTFRTHDRHCKRVHFFATDINEILNKPGWSARFEALQQTSKTSYCGFCVVRPLPSAPIGRTVLRARGPTGADLDSTVTCRADVRAHLFGADLDVTGTPFMQQDARVGACAQVAIWIGARHMHQRYKYNWMSVADITRLAVPTTESEATSLPAGADFLTSERMIRAISEMGFQPLCFSGQDTGAAILPYVESGVPVILGLRHKDTLGHAVTVIGRVFAKQKNPTDQAINYVPAFITHDDQAGPYMLVPMDKEATTTFGFDKNQTINHYFSGELVHLNVREHAVFAVALMPLRAFSTARAAEHTARNRLDAALSDLPTIETELADEGTEVDRRLRQDLKVAQEKNAIVLRTYLTSASGYRRHIAAGTACDELKGVLLSLHLPHFIWVTEISTIDSYNQASRGMRRMYGHTVLDATSTGKDSAGLLALHLPGLVILRDVNATPDQQEETGIIIQNDNLYECREKRFDH